MKKRGFSLIELLIVVAIILVISAIAIPNMLSARIRANEASAVASVRAVNTAQVSYVTTYPTVGYADELAKLGAPTDGSPVSATRAGLLDFVLGCASQPCSKSGYKFSVLNTSGSPISTYTVTGVPLSMGVSGRRGFCSDKSNALLSDPAGGTNCTSAIQ